LTQQFILQGCRLNLYLNLIRFYFSFIQTANKPADIHVSTKISSDSSITSSRLEKCAENPLIPKLDFLQIATTVIILLDKNANGKVSLIDVFKQLKVTLVLPLLTTKIELLGYITEFLSEICQISIEGYFLLNSFDFLYILILLFVL
jgi:hypothetical protein